VEIPEIGVEALADRLDGGAVVIDVRTPEEYAEAHVPGAVLLPLNELPERVEHLPEADELLVICRSGQRSRSACEFLINSGRAAVNVAGGTLAWIDSGRPVDAGTAG
jgi:rhodanese-related sulfurtransferase